MFSLLLGILSVCYGFFERRIPQALDGWKNTIHLWTLPCLKVRNVFGDMKLCPRNKLSAVVPT